MGTKLDESGLSTNEKDNTNTSLDDFDSISEALLSEDPSNLSRLMAAKEEDKDSEKEEEEEEENVTEDEDNESEEDDTEEKGEDSEEQDEPEEDKEAASKSKSAASTANKDEDLQAELHRLRSDAGRVPFLQRQLAELQRELRASKARSTQVSSGGKVNPADLTSVQLDEETQKEIDELKEVDPVLARTIERIAKTAIYTANSRADHVVDTLTQAEREQEEYKFLMEQKAILAQKIPQHEQIFSSQEWKQWKETLTPGQRALAESSYASEVETAIYAFAAEMRRRQGVQQNDAAGNQTPPAADNTVKKARQEKIKASPEVKNPNAKQREAFDAEQAFQEMYNEIGKANHILK